MVLKDQNLENRIKSIESTILNAGNLVKRIELIILNQGDWIKKIGSRLSKIKTRRYN